MERRGNQNIIVPVQMIVWKKRIAVSIIMLFVKVNALSTFLQSLLYVPVFIWKEQGCGIILKTPNEVKNLHWSTKEFTVLKNKLHSFVLRRGKLGWRRVWGHYWTSVSKRVRILYISIAMFFAYISFLRLFSLVCPHGSCLPFLPTAGAAASQTSTLVWPVFGHAY